VGRFDLAEGGTLFLDEIGELNLSSQVKILRVLQEREFERLGGTETVRVDVRLVVATNRDLEASIAEKQFREDLYYRLNGLLDLHAAFARSQTDIMLLADHSSPSTPGSTSADPGISTPAIDMLVSYHWPGNVRELEKHPRARGGHLRWASDPWPPPPAHLQTAEASGTVVQTSALRRGRAVREGPDRGRAEAARGNRAKAARLLGSTERIIGYKVRKYGIDPGASAGADGAPMPQRWKSVGR